MLRNWILKILLIRRNTLYSYLKIQIYDEEGDLLNTYTLGIDIGSTTVKIAILDENEKLLFADYERHFANIQETLADLLEKEALEAWDGGCADAAGDAGLHAGGSVYAATGDPPEGRKQIHRFARHGAAGDH